MVLSTVQQSVIVKQNTTGVPFTFNIVNADNTAANLTGLTVTLKTWVKGVPQTPVLNEVITVTNALGGIATWTPLTNDCTTVGSWEAALVLTKSNYNEATETFILTVQENA